MEPHSAYGTVELIVPEFSHHLLHVTVHHGPDLAVLLVLAAPQTLVAEVLHFFLRVSRRLELLNPCGVANLNFLGALPLFPPLSPWPAASLLSNLANLANLSPAPRPLRAGLETSAA